MYRWPLKNIGLNGFIAISIIAHSLGIGVGGYFITAQKTDEVVTESAKTLSLGMVAAMQIAQKEQTEQPLEKMATKPIVTPLPRVEPKVKPVIVTPREKQPMPIPVRKLENVYEERAAPIEPVRELTPTIRPSITTHKSTASTGSNRHTQAVVETGIAQQIGAASIRDIHDAHVLRHLKRFKRYPAKAKRRRIEGDIGVVFIVNRKGAVISVHSYGERQSIILERSALSQVNRASPFPSAPKETKWLEREYIVYIEYDIEDDNDN